MSILTMVQNLKQVHQKEVLLIKIGEFYHTYGKDAYIISYMFKYNIKGIAYNGTIISECGFNKKSLNKVMAGLEDTKINYMLLDRRNNYDVDYKSTNRNLNCYDIIYSKAKKYILLLNRIENIYNNLMDNILSQETIKKIEKIEKVLSE